MLPISSYPDKNISFIDALFTATSASCVTGLVTFDTNTTWTSFGKAVILILIQIGGLGIMSIFTIFALLSRKQLNLTERLTISETINDFNLNSVVNVFLKILFVTLAFELSGAVILFFQLEPIYGTLPAITKSIFISISAFCNAGFDVLGTNEAPFSSLTSLNTNPVILSTLSALVIIGGLGFVVWKDLWRCKWHFKKYTLHTKVVLIVSFMLLLLGTGFMYAFESNNTLSGMNFNDKLVNSFFASVTTRTAGFNSIENSALAPASKLLMMIFMVIGGAPGSTAGGIKVTTIAILILAAISFIRGRDDIEVMRYSISYSTIFKSVCIFMLALLIIFTSAFIVLLNNNFEFVDVLYEVTSAFGTVGLSTGITPMLNTLSKIVIMFCMFLGRLGPLSLVIAFSRKQILYKPSYKYSEGKISVG